MLATSSAKLARLSETRWLGCPCRGTLALVFPRAYLLAAIVLVREPLEQVFTNQGHSPWLRHAFAEAWLRSARVGPHAGRMPH